MNVAVELKTLRGGASFAAPRGMTAADAIGWTSSAILVVTLGHQVFKQWKDGRSEGVSIWLFVGQVAASIGFLVYSISLHSWVFTVTNSLLLANAVAGGLITLHQKRRSISGRYARRDAPLPPPSDEPTERRGAARWGSAAGSAH